MKAALKAIGLGVLSAAIALAPAHAPAFAEPSSVEQDKTDNQLTFSYDAGSGTLTGESSYRRAESGAVRFEVAVAESEGYGAGVVGKLRLRLEDDHAYLYDGWFELRVTNTSGESVYVRTRPATIHLKPRPGQRRASLAFKFDLPSGT